MRYRNPAARQRAGADNWYGGQGFRHHPTADWVQVCDGGEGKVCSRELFHGGFSLHAEVAEVLIQAPDETEVSATLGAHSYVFRHVEERVDPNRAANDMQSLPSVPVTLADASGSPIITYDYFPSYVVPEECLDNEGGCGVTIRRAGTSCTTLPSRVAVT